MTTSAQPGTDSVETIPAVVADAGSSDVGPSDAGSPPPGIRAALTDPVLRVLTGATLVSTLGRGIFFTLTVLFFTRFVGLNAGEIALILAASSGVGVVTSYAGGHFADLFSARRMLVALIALEGLTMAAYPFAADFSTALLLACIATGLNRASNSTRAAMIARAFDAEHRVATRAILRAITNVGIAVGGAIGGLALLAGTVEAYRGLMIAAGVVYLLSALQLLRLPARVDAPPRERRARLAPDADTASIAAHEVATARQAAAAAAASARSPFRDKRYLALTALAGVFGMQFALGEIGVPLWIVHNTAAPDVLVSVLLIINTVIVIALQIPLSRGTDDIRKAGRSVLLAGAFMLLACGLYALAAGPDATAGSLGVGAGVAIALLVGGALFHSFAEILSQAGTWGLSFELADPRRAGAYQGMFGMGFSLGTMLAPLVITATALQLGTLGWAILAALFVASAIGIWLIARRAAPAEVRQG